MTIDAVFQHVGKWLSLRQEENRATRWYLIDSKQWLSQTDEIKSEPADYVWPRKKVSAAWRDVGNARVS
jgi:hypothetical protein